MEKVIEIQDVKLKASAIIHRDEKRIKLVFDYNLDIINKVKELKGRKWSQTLKCWHIPYREDFEEYLANTLKGSMQVKPATQVKSIEKEENQEMKVYRDVMGLKRLSPRTQELYTPFFKEYVKAYEGKDIAAMSYQEIHDYVKQRASYLKIKGMDLP